MYIFYMHVLKASFMYIGMHCICTYYVAFS